MGDHLVLCVDRLITPQSLESIQGTDSPGSSLGSTCSQNTAEVPTFVINVEGVEQHVGHEEEELLIQTAECRICQEEDTLKNLEVPCACSGSLKVSFNMFFFLSDRWRSAVFSLSFCPFYF